MTMDKFESDDAERRMGGGKVWCVGEDGRVMPRGNG